MNKAREPSSTIWPGKRSSSLIEPSVKRDLSRRKGRAHAASVSDAQARKTAFLVAAVLLLIAGWQIYRGRITAAAVFTIVSGALTFIGFFIPVAARAFHHFWMGIAGILGYINSRILLGLLYYGVFTPYGLIR